MDIGKSFRFVFDDKDWATKLLLGLLISIVPILNLAWNGYLVQLVRNVSEDAEFPLPEWSDFGDKFVKGLILFLVAILYALPVVIVIVVIALGGLATGLSTDGNITDTVASIFAGVGILLGCLITVYLLALTFYLPAVYVHFSREGTFGSCFEIGKIINLISANIGEYLTAWIVSLLFGIVIGVIASILFTILALIVCIGWILALILAGFLTVWPTAVIAHMFGQIGTLKPTLE